MIATYGDAATCDVHFGHNTKAARSIPKDLWPVVRRKLNLIDAARSLADLRVPPSNRLEKLVGNLAGRLSIRVNDQWRIVFTFSDDGSANAVQVVDYHQ